MSVAKLQENFSERSKAGGFIQAKALETFSKENLKLTYPILLDPDGHVPRAYKLRWVLVTIVVGRDGRIIEKILGVRPWGSKEMMESFDRLLNEFH